MLFSDEQVVESFYRAALNRAPDEDGLKSYLKRLRAHPTELMSIAKDLFNSEEHRTLMTGAAPLTDHSQFGEFTMLLRRLTESGSKRQLIVDVGARGRERSNSYDLLSQFAWKGLLIEANPALYDEISSAFLGTDFKLVSCAVGTTECVMPFYIGSNDDVSSLIKDAASGWGDLRGEVEVDVRRLPNILDELNVPLDFDVLSLDIEGVDVPVLNDFIETSLYRPRYIIIEASYSFQTKHLSDVGSSAKVQSLYEIVDQTEANLILSLHG